MTLLSTAPLASGQAVKTDAHGFVAVRHEELNIGEGGANSVTLVGRHYDGAKDEEAIVQIMGMGRVTTTQLQKR